MPGPGHGGGRGHFMRDGKKYKRKINAKTLWKWMFSYLDRYKVLFFLLTGLLILFMSAQAFLPMIQQAIIDRGIYIDDGNGNISSNWTFAIQFLFLYASVRLFSVIGRGIVEYYTSKIGTKVVYDVRDDLFHHLQNTSMNYYDKVHSGDIISIATNDVDQLNQIFGGQLAMMISDIFTGLMVIILMLIMDWELALLSFTIIPVFVLIMRKFITKVRSGFKLARKKISKVTSVAEQNISGMKVIQAYGKQNEAAKEFDAANRENQATMLKIRKVMAFLIPLITGLAYVYSAGITLYGGLGFLNGSGIFGRSISLGTVTSFTTYLMQLLMPLVMLGMFSQMAESMLAAAERVYLLLHEETEIADPVNPKPFDHIAGNIQFDQVEFSYSKRETKEEFAQYFKTAEEDQWLKASKGNDSDFKKNAQKKRKMSRMKPNLAEKSREPAALHPGQSSSPSHMNRPSLTSQQFLDMARKLDEMLKGSKGGLSVSAGSSGGMNGGSMGSGGKSPDAMLSKDKILQILGSPQVPPEVYEQFSATVKAVIKEDQEMRKHAQSTGKIIDNVSFQIPAGKTIAIVGPTGAGKTTLIKLLARFYDLEENHGIIAIDGCNIKEITKNDLRQAIGMVPQDSFLFTGSILDNLYYGVPSSVDKTLTPELLDISKFLGLHNFIENMPDKYDTPLRENAANLSVGQRQLIAFARVLMLDPKILILDEATSAVDPYTESLIQDALDKIKAGRTTIIIAHRLSTIKNADEIFVLDQGKITEHGSHDDLIALNGHYANLITMQAKDIA